MCFLTVVIFLLGIGGLSGCGSGGGGAQDTPSGGGGQNSPPAQSPTVTVGPNRTLMSNSTQYSFDVYQASNADKAVIFLHGGGGTKYGFACQIGLNLSTSSTNGCNSSDPFNATDYSTINSQVLTDNKAIAVFPQGKSIPGAPGAYTWSNYVMTSGQNDMQFLADLVSYLNSTYKVNKFYLVGHSNGAMMANRVWCENPGLFSGYVAVSGPPSTQFLHSGVPTCNPAQVQPYMGIIGSYDTVLQVINYTTATGPEPHDNNWESDTWTINPLLDDAAFLNHVVLGERWYLPYRVNMSCNGTVAAGDSSSTSSDNGILSTWSFCNNSIQLIRVNGSGHDISSSTDLYGEPAMDTVVGQYFVLNTAFSFISSH